WAERRRSCFTYFGTGSMAVCERAGDVRSRKGLERPLRRFAPPLLTRRGIVWRFILITVAILLLYWPKPDQAAETDRKTRKIDLFQTSDRCFACHNGLATSSGEDISIGLSWRPTMMANSARDPYWQAGVRRETLDHPESKAAIEDECAICHMAMARYQSKYEGKEGEVFSHLVFGSSERMDRLAQDRVSCSMCHQITEDKLGTRESFVGGFVVDTTKSKGERAEYGPFKIEDGQTRLMRTSSGGYRPTES